ncbi:MAG: hypothetical protein WDA16_09085 [Candidatus Thermoplasmatota archaeon]
MRRDTLLAVGFLLAAIAELQWATTWFKATDARLSTTIAAMELFAAGAALLLAAGGLFFAEHRGWALFLGLMVAAVAHAAFVVTTVPLPILHNVAAALAFVGLIVAAWGARESTYTPIVVRGGLAIAAIAGIVWIIAGMQSDDSSFMVGNAFAVIGFGMGAFFAGPAAE